MLQQKQLQQVLTMYSLHCRTFLPTEKGYRNYSHPVVLDSGHVVNLILYKNEPGILSTIQRSNEIAAVICSTHIPARRQIDPRILSLRIKGVVQYIALYDYLPGATIPWEAYTMKHLKELGRVQSNLHASLKGYTPKHTLPDITDVNQALLHRMGRYFTEPGVARALSNKLGLRIVDGVIQHLQRVTVACSQLVGIQPLHMDFVRGNILFNDQADITGVLDFEKTALGHPIFDIARTYAFLLVDCKYKTEEKIRKYFIDSGYKKRGEARYTNVRLHNEDLLEVLTTFYLLYDLYKFLRHNPYESLPENEHFVRTVTYLVNRRQIDGKIPPIRTRENI